MYLTKLDQHHKDILRAFTENGTAVFSEAKRQEALGLIKEALAKRGKTTSYTIKEVQEAHDMKGLVLAVNCALNDRFNYAREKAIETNPLAEVLHARSSSYNSWSGRENSEIALRLDGDIVTVFNSCSSGILRQGSFPSEEFIRLIQDDVTRHAHHWGEFVYALHQAANKCNLH